MVLKDKISMIDDLIKEDSNASIGDYINIIEDIKKIEATFSPDYKRSNTQQKNRILLGRDFSYEMAV